LCVHEGVFTTPPLINKFGQFMHMLVYFYILSFEKWIEHGCALVNFFVRVYNSPQAKLLLQGIDFVVQPSQRVAQIVLYV
jgi:hypothetical protein